MFEDELRSRIQQIVGLEPPSEDVRQWLGEHNLGLVPVAEPQSFSWAGYWIGRFGERAVLMYGSPSGPVEPVDGEIEEGWVVAELDLHLPAYETPSATGTVVGLLVAPEAESPLEAVDQARALPGRGLEGDRYAAGRGTFGHGARRGYELTLVESEALADVGLTWEEARRNVVTSGISLNGLVGKRFRIGDVEIIGRRLAEPCAHLERLVRPGIMRPLVHRAGLRADILSEGVIRIGDQVG